MNGQVKKIEYKRYVIPSLSKRDEIYKCSHFKKRRERERKQERQLGANKMDITKDNFEVSLALVDETITKWADFCAIDLELSGGKNISTSNNE